MTQQEREQLHTLAENAAYYMRTGMGRETLQASIERALEVEPATSQEAQMHINLSNLDNLRGKTFLQRKAYVS